MVVGVVGAVAVVAATGLFPFGSATVDVWGGVELAALVAAGVTGGVAPLDDEDGGTTDVEAAESGCVGVIVAGDDVDEVVASVESVAPVEADAVEVASAEDGGIAASDEGTDSVDDGKGD